MVNLTRAQQGRARARLLDLVPGRSDKAYADSLTVTVMDPSHVVRLASDALDQCRRRIRQGIHGHRGRKDDPLYKAGGTLHTGADLLTDQLKDRPADLSLKIRTRRLRRPGGSTSA